MKQPAERTASLVRQARLISQQLSKFFPYDPREFKTYIFQSQKSWLPDLHPYAKSIMRHYIAMNRFRIVKGQESEFEEIWKTRNTYLENEPGFIKFNLLKGPEREDHLLYASHTLWESEDHFVAWTKSEAFRKAHAGAGNRGHLYLGHPEFEGFETVEGASVG